MTSYQSELAQFLHYSDENAVVTITRPNQAKPVTKQQQVKAKASNIMAQKQSFKFRLGALSALVNAKSNATVKTWA